MTPDDTPLMLDLLLGMVNRAAAEIPITLFVSGAVVTGDLVSRNAFMDAFVDTLASAFSKEAPAVAETIRDAVKRAEETVQAEPTSEADDDARETESFVCLKNARILAGRQLLPNLPAGWWCGRKRSVDAFFLGSLS